MIKSCSECSQYVVKEIEPELPAFCLYWKEGLMLASPTCRNYKEGRIPEEPVSPLSGLETAAPHDQAGSADYRVTSQLHDQNFSKRGDDNTLPSPQAEQREADLHPGRHLVKIISVRAYMHNFQEYSGTRVRLTLKVLEGPDVGKFLFNNISLPHPKESKGMLQRRVRLACRLGLVAWGTQDTVHINWKSLQGRFCRVDVAYKNLGGGEFLTVGNYELIEGAHTQPAHLLHLARAEEELVVEEHHEPALPSTSATCESCPWYALNPWSHYPDFGEWCHYRMEHLVVGSAACEEFRRDEVPPRQPYEQVPAVPTATAPAPQEHILTCFDCPMHEHDPINPPEGWGRCALKKRAVTDCGRRVLKSRLGMGTVPWTVDGKTKEMPNRLKI